MPYERDRGRIGRVHPFKNFFLVHRDADDAVAGWGALQVGARFSYVDLTDRDVLGGRGRNISLAANWWWTSHSRIQFNATYGDIRNRAPIAGFTGGHFVGLGTGLMIDY